MSLIICILATFINGVICQFILPEPQFNSPQFLPQNSAVLGGIPLQGPLQNVVITNSGGIGPHVSIAVLGQQCSDNFTCVGIPNAICSVNKTCQCAANFIEDTVFTGTCRLAPGFSEVCNQKELQCRTPFVCNSTGLCDCANGFIQEFFQCIKDCPAGEIPIGNECHPVKKLDDTCEKNEQCAQTYAQCLHNKCQCIQGANQIKGECVPVTQCPMGEPLKDANGDGQRCSSVEPSADNTCPSDYYCLQFDVSESNGFCCPKIKMNCPIGKPLDGHNCTTCPWETHHCFSYVIGRFTDTMCCPNACPTSHPIQKGGKCYARSAFDGHCSVDEQCYSVLNAVCRQNEIGSDNATKCSCPVGNYKYYFGRCVKESNLGDQCDTNEDCKLGSGTQCLNNVCACVNGQIPEPVKNPKHDSPQRCIGEPTCPRSFGRERAQPFTDCSFNSGVCKETEDCKSWWVSANVTFSLCCSKPTDSDYEAICNQYNLKLSKIGNEPRRCDILPFTQNFFLNDAIKRNDELTICAVGSSCLLDPFDGNRGICCEPPLLVKSSNNFTTAATDPPETTVFTNTFKPKRTTTTTPTVSPTEESLAVENPVKTAVEHHSKNYHHNGPVRIITAETFKRVQSKHEK